jgi:lysophospholipase L1-like esterase
VSPNFRSAFGQFPAWAITWPVALICAFTLHSCSTPDSRPRASNPALEQRLGAEVARIVEEDRANPPAVCQVLFVGSSTIVRWRGLEESRQPLPVINRGFGGSHIEYVNRWFDEIVAANRPRAIVLYAGENDVRAGKPVEQILEDFDAFMSRKRHTLGRTPVYFISIKVSPARMADHPRQVEVNDAIRSLASHQGDLHFIDVTTPMLEKGSLDPLFAADGVHMSSEGYAIWTPIVRSALLRAAEDQERRCIANT